MKRIPWTQEWNPWAITCTNWASSMAFTPTEAADWHGFVQAKLGAESKSFCGHFGLNRKHQFGPKETRANQWKITSYRYTVILHDGTNHGHTMLYSWDNHQLYCLPMGKIHCWKWLRQASRLAPAAQPPWVLKLKMEGESLCWLCCKEIYCGFMEGIQDFWGIHIIFFVLMMCEYVWWIY